MIKKLLKYGKIVIAMTLIGALTLPSYATVGASDGSAFVTKAEFDAALSDFNARLTTFEAGINSKIDSQVSSYLDRNGIWAGKAQDVDLDVRWGHLWPYSDFFSPADEDPNLQGIGAYSWFKNVFGTTYTKDWLQKAQAKPGGKQFFYLPNKKTYGPKAQVTGQVTKSGLCCMYLYHSQSAYLYLAKTHTTTYSGAWLDKIKNVGGSNPNYQTLLDITDDYGYSNDSLWALTDSDAPEYPYGLMGGVQILTDDNKVKFNVQTFSATLNLFWKANAAKNNTSKNTTDWARVYNMPGCSPQFVIAQFFVNKGQKLFLRPFLISTGNCSNFAAMNCFVGYKWIDADYEPNDGWFNYIAQVSDVVIY